MENNDLMRLALVRISLGIVIFLTVVLGVDDLFYLENTTLLYEPKGLLYFLPELNSYAYYSLKYVVLISAFFFTIGWFTKTTAIILAITFLIFNYYTSQFSLPAWNYNTHLNFFLFAMCFSICDRYFSLQKILSKQGNNQEQTTLESTRNSNVLAFMQFYVLFLYFQAFTCKLLYCGGLEWFISGRVAFITTIMYEVPLGMMLSQWPEVFAVMTVAVGIIELSAIFIYFLMPQLRTLIVLVLIATHFGMYLILDISFWHLWILFPALFLFYSNSKEQNKNLVSVPKSFVME